MFNFHSSEIKPPRYIVNPAAAQRSVWYPHPYQLVFGHQNKSWLNSAWIGTVVNLSMLPRRLFVGFVVPRQNMSRLKLVIFSLMAVIPATLVMAWAGLMGDLMAIDVSHEVATSALVLPPDQGQFLVGIGQTDVVFDLESDASNEPVELLENRAV